MKGRVEARDLRQVRKAPADDPDRFEVVRLVQWREWHQRFKLLEDGVVDENGPQKGFSAMHHPVPDGRELASLLMLPQPRDKMHERLLVTDPVAGPGNLVRSLPSASLTAKRAAPPKPSKRPLKTTRGSAPSGVSKIWNLRLDEPALRTMRAGSHESDLRDRQSPALRVGHERGDGAGGEACDGRVGPAGQDDRHAGAEHDAGGIGVGKEGQALGQHVAGLEIGHDEHVGLTGDGRLDVLDLRGAKIDRVVERKGTIEDGAGNLARGRPSCTRPRPRWSRAPSG